MRGSNGNEKAKIIRDARKQGIIDVDPVSIETLALAAKLVKKHKHEAYKRLEKRLKEQKN